MRPLLVHDKAVKGRKPSRLPYAGWRAYSLYKVASRKSTSDVGKRLRICSVLKTAGVCLDNFTLRQPCAELVKASQGLRQVLPKLRAVNGVFRGLLDAL
jgi:hypothetical protein